MKTLILNYLPTNFKSLSFKDKKIVLTAILLQIDKSKNSLANLIN